MTALIEKLRENTQCLHSKLDNLPCLSILMSEDLTSNSYLDALKALYFPFAIYKGQINRFMQLYQHEYKYFSRSEFLRSDIEELIGKSYAQQAEYYNDITYEDFVGILYVLEGSRLGGKFIAKKISSHDLPMSFFCSSSDERVSWRKFLDYLALVPEKYHKSIVNSAMDTFQFFIDSMSASNIDATNSLIESELM